MPSRSRTRRALALPFLLAVPLGVGCANTELEAARKQIDGLEDRQVALQTSLDEALALAEANAAEAARATEALAAQEKQREQDEKQRAEDEKQREEDEKLLKETAAHRDELVEWIEEDLLPVAEEKDERLRNLKQAAEDMAAQVEVQRGLKFKRPFMRRLVRREQVGEWMKRDLKKELPQEEADKLVRVGAEMGLMKPGTDIYDMFSGFLEGGAAAFYKPQTNTFYLIEGADGAGARPIVFHELIHAVEDQYFELDTIYRELNEDTDRSLAARGLIEGSAEFFTNRYSADHPDEVKQMMADQMKLAGKQMKMVREIPPFLLGMMALYPYKNGAAWLTAIGVEGADDVERLFEDMPVSTEQVLHPEKFPLEGARDYPHLVSPPEIEAVLGDGWEEVAKDSMGELLTGCLLAQLSHDAYFPAFVSIIDMQTQGVGFKGDVKTAVEGWDGDRYTAYVRSGTEDVCIVWTLAFDSAADAAEFARIYGGLLGKRVTGTVPEASDAPQRFTAAEGDVSGVEVHDGSVVVVVLSAPADKVDALFQAGRDTAIAPDPRDASDQR